MHTTDSWTVLPRTVSFGINFVQLTAYVPGNPEWTGYDYGFVKVGRGPLVIEFVKGPTRDVSVNRNITINATLSYDPNEFTGPGNVI